MVEEPVPYRTRKFKRATEAPPPPPDDMVEEEMNGPQPYEYPDDLPDQDELDELTDLAEPVVIDGVTKRVTNLKLLNKRYAILQTAGAASVYVSRPDFQPIQDVDLKRRLAPEVVITGLKDGKKTYKSAFTAWTGNAKRHVYSSIVFTSKPVADDVYNLFRGLGVTPKKGDCHLILKHILEVLCSGDKDTANDMVRLIAWQLQNIGQPSRIVVVMTTKKQQAGKGLILAEVLGKIFGPSGFTPSSTDQVLGRLNDPIRGCAYVFLDEVLFAGDRKAADGLKSLSTSTEIGIETKGLPVIKCPIAVNLWLASNHEAAARGPTRRLRRMAEDGEIAGCAKADADWNPR
jgi:hypothetical protein